MYRAIDSKNQFLFFYIIYFALKEKKREGEMWRRLEVISKMHFFPFKNTAASFKIKCKKDEKKKKKIETWERYNSFP